MKKYLFFTVLLSGLIACQQPKSNAQENETAGNDKPDREQVVLKDYGAEPQVINIEDYTVENETFRTALWTGSNLQLTVMSVPVGGEVGLEMHGDIEQFLRIEDGEGQVLMGNAQNSLTFIRLAGKDDAIFVPSGVWHNIINTGDRPLKLYSIYARPEHPHGTVHQNKAESDAAHHEHE